MAVPEANNTFPERHGPTVLLVVGGLLCAAAAASALGGHPWGLGLAVPGLVALGFGTVVSRMEDEFRFLGLHGKLRGTRGEPPENPRGP